MESLQVAVGSRHPLVLEGIRALLARVPLPLDVVDLAAHDGPPAGFDVIVYDLEGLRDHRGDDLVRLVRAHTAVIGVERDHDAELLDRAIAAGITRTVPLSVSADELGAAIMAAYCGESVGDTVRTRSRMAMFNAREAQVLALLASGKTNAEIADALYLGVNTVKTHIKSLYKKMGVTRRSQAVIWYLAAGATPSSEPGPNLMTRQRVR